MTDALDQAAAAANALAGTGLRIESWNQEAGLDTIRHYAWGLGDRNPLFWDPDYAEASPVGGVVAPPTYLLTVFDAVTGIGFKGFQPIYGGADLKFTRRIRRGERLKAEATLGSSRIVEGRMVPRYAVQEVDVVYWANSSGDWEEVGRALGRTLMIARRHDQGGLAYEPRRPTYTRDELVAIQAEVEAEVCRGMTPRLAREVKVGDRLPAVVKGPINPIDMIAYYAGCIGSPGYKSAEIAWLYRRWAVESPDRLPNNVDAWYFAPTELPSSGHIDPSAGEVVGMPGAYANGLQMIGWAAHCLTNWLGDQGFLSTLATRLTRPVVFGDVVRISGEVTAVDPDEGSVQVILKGTNQLNEPVLKASASALLPRSANEVRSGAPRATAVAG